MASRLEAHLRRLQARNYDWPIPWRAVELIARKEDCRLAAYLCPAGKPTIGWGETDGITLGMHWTEDQCDSRLLQQVRKRAARVEALCTIEPDPNQLGAMVSLNYNIGNEGFARSTVLKQHNLGNFSAAARAFGLWNKARVNGVLTVLDGLTSRRAAEAALYLEPAADQPRDPMPQVVEAESSLVQSPIQKSAATVGVSGLAIATQMFDGAKEIGDRVTEFIGLPMPAIAAVVLILAAGVIMYWRNEQRKQGFA